MNSVFNNGAMFGSQYGGGMQYAGQPKDIQWTNPLSPEEERELHRGASALSLDIPKENMFRAKCTHRDPATHQFTVRPADDGNGYICTKCGSQFNIVDNVDIQKIKEIIGGTIDILQTTKMAYVDMAPEIVQTYFIILPFLELAPKLYEASMQTLKKAMPNASLGANAVSGDYYNSYYSMIGNPYGAMGVMPGAYPGAMPQGYPGMMPNMGYQNPMMGTPAGAVPDAANPLMAAQGVVPQANTVVDGAATEAKPAEGTPVTTSSKYSLA